MCFVSEDFFYKGLLDPAFVLSSLRNEPELRTQRLARVLSILFVSFLCLGRSPDLKIEHPNLQRLRQLVETRDRIHIVPRAAICTLTHPLSQAWRDNVVEMIFNKMRLSGIVIKHKHAVDILDRLV